MIENNPKVSVIIPTYNCGKYIIEAIKCVLSQTYQNMEILIVDDGSIDNTKEIVKSIKSEDIRYYFQENRGASAARNKGIKESNGHYVAFLDADDLWKENKIEESISFMEDNNFDWICTSYIKKNEKGNENIRRIPEDSWAINTVTKEINMLKNGIFFFSELHVHTCTIVVKKKCFEKSGLFDETFMIGEDTDLWLRFEESGFRGGYLDEPLTVYRYNASSLTKSGRVDGLREHVKVAKKHANILGLDNHVIREAYSRFLWHVADTYYTDKQYINSIKCVIFSVYYDKSHIKKIFKKICNL